MTRWMMIAGAAMTTALLVAGCNSTTQPGPAAPTDADNVAAKAESIALDIGDTNGFAPGWLDGYRQHFGPMMGFTSAADLADPDQQMTIQFQNDSDLPCTFHVVYDASYMGLQDESVDVPVDPDETVDFNIPCAEIVGIGSVDQAGQVAVDAGSNGMPYANDYCVPGFLNADYTCGGQYDCYFGPDVDDLDADGDTSELIVTTSPLYAHMGPGGMMDHHHDMGMGMFSP